MKKRDCIEAVKRVAPSLSDGDLIEIFNAANKRIAKQRKGINTLNKIDSLDDWAKGESERLRHENISKARQLYLNYEARKNGTAYIENQVLETRKHPRYKDKFLNKAFGDVAEYREAVTSLLVGSRGYRNKNGRLSIAGTQLAHENAMQAKLYKKLSAFKEDNLAKRIAKDEGFNRKVISHIIDGNQNDKAVIHTAEAISEIFEDGRQLVNRYGGEIGKIDRYVPQAYDPIKLIKAGKTKWVNDVVDKIDIERSLGDVDRDEAVEILKGIYDTLVTGVENNLKAREIGVRSSTGVKSKGMEHARILHYKDAESWFAIKNNYGHGTIFSDVLSHVRRSANTAGLMQRLGANSELNLQTILDNIKTRIKESDLSDARKKKEIDALDFNKYSPHSLRSMYAMVSGEVDGISGGQGQITTARIMGALRAWQNIAKLGGVVISSLSDIPLMALSLSRTGIKMNKAYSALFKQAIADPKQRRIARELGAGLDGWLGSIASRYSAEDAPLGMANSIQTTFFKLTGLTQWTDFNRSMAQTIRAYEIGRAANEVLNNDLSKLLSNYGIDDDIWDVIKKAAVKDETINTTYLTSDNIRKLDDEAFYPLIEAEYLRKSEVILKKNKEANLEALKKRMLKEAKEESAMKLQVLYSDQNLQGVLQPDARTRAQMMAGEQRGTLKGEVLRSTLHLKSFTWAYMAQILLPLVREKGVLEASKMIAVMSVIGALAITLKDIASGKTPMDASNPKFWTRAIAQGGGFGVFADILYLPQSNPRQLLGTALGPVPSSL
ncbi:MAG: hypothetical protein AAF403_03585, partial [Pseudomonadota bacterium]